MEEQGNKKARAPIEVGEREPRFREEVLGNTCDCRPARFGGLCLGVGLPAGKRVADR